jgi:hypothetical protein
MPASCCLVNPLKKRLNKGMKQLGLFQQQLQRNQQISFFAEGPPPVTAHGVGSGTGQMELPSQREVLLSNPWPGERQIPKPSIPNIPVTTKPAVIAQSGQITGILKNETNLTHFPQINALWEKFGLRHVS